MRMDNNPLGIAFEAMLKNLFWYHPYGVPPIGYPYHIDAYTNEAAQNHYKTWYVPNNAVLMVSGDITMETLMPLVEQNFGSIPSKALPNRERPQEPDHKGVTQDISFASPRVSFTSFSWYYPTPSFRTDKENFYGLIVLTHILGGNSISRLYAHLVDGNQMAIEASANFDSTLDPRYLSVSATLHPGVKEADLIQAVGNHVNEIVTHGITEEELKVAKRDLLADLAFSKDGTKGPLSAFSDLAYGFSVEEIENYPARINAVTVADVHRAAKKYLSVNPTVKMKIYPDKPAGADQHDTSMGHMNINDIGTIH
jgi:zinc protease